MDNAMLESVRVADRDDLLARPQLVGVAQFDSRKILGVDADHGQAIS